MTSVQQPIVTVLLQPLSTFILPVLYHTR